MTVADGFDVQADDDAENDADNCTENTNHCAGHEENPLNSALARPHGAQDGDIGAFALDQHYQAGNDIQGGNQDNQGENQKHHIALNSQRIAQ